MTTLLRGSPLKCPHCDSEQEGPIEDYVVQGPHGLRRHWYFEDCGSCDEEFGVRRLEDDTYEVYPDTPQ